MRMSFVIVSRWFSVNLKLISDGKHDCDLTTMNKDMTLQGLIRVASGACQAEGITTVTVETST